MFQLLSRTTRQLRSLTKKLTKKRPGKKLSGLFDSWMCSERAGEYADTSKRKNTADDAHRV
jgi:hypothetical protein